MAVLEVIDRLQVGPVHLDPDRLVAPYRVDANGKSDNLELVYRFEEPVFDPADPGDQNLAAVMAAQVALNYGLFCRHLVFVGAYDMADQRFLQEMLANTAREIFVKKLLEPNPFLQGPVSELQPQRRDSYVRCNLTFEEDGAGSSPPKSGSGSWSVDSDRYAVLSSGGKDSLLSFGLLEEMGLDTHPIFVNESGRHWFTALNAYRHFRSSVAGTARVWTNSDRLFSWMLRHLPFVRQDFAQVRSDEYPIRLWTVAVFLFGVLPLLRKRGIGRLVIGDEHDTTVRSSYKGIVHYNGLFDQSRYFDHALTRYFQRKGWGLTQFSLVRPLSELLIEKTLAHRYPHLQRHQVSCHATHVEGERVHPCGRCEKCRRIAGMLLAVEADPTACGYSQEQIEKILPALVEKGVHQERPAAELLAHMLWEKGRISEPRLGAHRARLHPEILKLRFHPEKSPPDELPISLRGPLFSILLEEAEGAVRRLGRRWIDFDLQHDPELSHPYRFDRPQRGAEKQPPPAVPAGEGQGQEVSSYLWGELTWPEAEKRFRQVDIALLPVGAVEQHGPHLPLDTDAFDAEYLARQVALGCSDPKPLVLPLVPYGVSYHHDDFSGTLSVSNDALSRYVYEIGMSTAKNGITKLVIVNAHGGNGAALHFAAQMINRDARIFTCVDSGETSDADIYAMTETPNDVHAGEIETSTSLAVRPGLVRMEGARRYVPRFSSAYLDFTSRRSVGWYARTARISPSGVLGDPTKASKEKGERIWRVMIERLVELVEHLKGLSLEEIHERRY